MPFKCDILVKKGYFEELTPILSVGWKNSEPIEESKIIKQKHHKNEHHKLVKNSDLENMLISYLPAWF